MDKICPNCLQNIPSRIYDVHKSTCKRHITFCEDCCKPVRNSNLADHKKELHQPIPCPQCNYNVPPHLMELHKTNVCPATIGSCEYCCLRIKRSHLSDHIKMCGQRTEPCQRCFTKVKLFEMKEHKDIGCSNPVPTEPPQPTLDGLELDSVSPHITATHTNHTQQDFISQSDDIEIIECDPLPTWRLAVPEPQRSMYDIKEAMDCESPLTHETSFPQEPCRPLFNAWTDDKTPVHSLRQENFGRDIDSDNKLPLQLQQEPPEISNPLNDIEYARKLQEEKIKKKLTPQIDETLAKQYRQQELPATPTTSSDIEYARKLQEEENKVHLISQINGTLAKQYRQQELPATATTSSDIEYARKLQEEENEAHLTSKIDETLAKQYQQAEMPHVSTDDDCYQTLLQAEEQRRKIHESDLELARKLQHEDTTVTSLTRLNTDSDIALALTLQNEESMTVALGGSFVDMELARKLQEEENERILIQAEHAAKDFEMAQKLHKEMNRGNMSLASSSDMTTGAATLPRVEVTKVDSRPPEWQEQLQRIEVFFVLQGSAEWTKVEQKFKSTLSNQIVSISRIQNTWLWNSYCFHRKQLHQKNNGAVNEMELFHGTRGNDPKLIYKGEQGFDMRFSSKGMWGMANYFAVKASYSNSYAFKGPDGCMEMFLAKVLTGESYRCPPNSNLRKPPQKPSIPSEQNMLLDYDTVTGETNGSQVFMTYDNCKAYPAYIIKYR